MELSKQHHEYEEYPLPRGTLTEHILEILSRGAEASGALLGILASEVTNFSMRPNLRGYPPISAGDWATSYRESRSFHSLLAKLKRDGIIMNKGKRRSFTWHITSRGRTKLTELRERIGLRRSSTPQFPLSAPDGKVRIVAYDIPERVRAKRMWIAEMLRGFGYELLQRSLWIGKRPLPEAFLGTLRRQRILSCVHIFEVGKSGTIKQLVI